MRLTYRAKYTNKETGHTSYFNTPTRTSYSHFATAAGAQHLINQVTSEFPRAKDRNIIEIVTEYVEDDYKYVLEKY